MLVTHHHHYHSTYLFSPISHPLPLLPSFSSPKLPTSFTVHARLRKNHQQWLAQLPEPTSPPQEEGPFQLPPSSPAIFATDNDPSPIQVATSVLLTGAISIFLFRSLRRRAKRSKELRFRSTGAKKTIQEEALDSLKAIKLTPVDGDSPPSAAQALLGGLTAGVIALVLYKFTTTIEAALNRQTISDSFSVRQITITVRTIINGLCYLATFIFGFNSVGLILYSGQLAFKFFMDDSLDEDNSNKEDGSTTLLTQNTIDNEESSSSNNDQSSDRSK